MNCYKSQLFLKIRTDRIIRKVVERKFTAINIEDAKQHIQALYSNIFSSECVWDHIYNDHYRQIEKPAEFIISKNDDSLYLTEE